MSKPVVCLVISSLMYMISTVAVHADMTLAEYRKIDKKDQKAVSIIQIMLGGTGEGFVWANAALAHENGKKLYCQPEISLSGVNYQSILDNEVKRVSYRPDTPLAYILLQGLQTIFPCK